LSPFSTYKYHLDGWGKTDNAVVDAIKLILLIYNNFSIVKKVAKILVWVKLTLSRLPTNTELISNKLVLIKLYKRVNQIK